MKTIALAGATGFLGSNLLAAFLELGFKVIVLKRTTSNTYRINQFLHRVELYDIDIISISEVLNICKVDIVVNTVCGYGRSKSGVKEVLNSNLLFGIELLEASVSNNIKSFIHTDTLLPRNLNIYSLSKAQFVDWLIFFSEKIQIVNFRIEHMYGPDDDKEKFLPWLIYQMLHSDNDINLTSGEQQRDFIYIDDVVNAYTLVISNLMNLPSWNQFDVGTNKFITLKKFVLQVASEVMKVVNFDVVQKLKFGVVPYRKGEVMIPVLNNEPLLQLGWTPTVDLNEGLKNIIKKYK